MKSYVFIFFMLFMILVLPSNSVAQSCLVSGATGSFCDTEFAACSPPAGGRCRQVTDRNGLPDGCVCSAIMGGSGGGDRKLFIVSELPKSGLTLLDIILGVALVIVTIVAVIFYRKRQTISKSG